MKRVHVLVGAASIACALGVTVDSSHASTQYLIAQCFENAACWTSGTPTPWSDTLTGAQLAGWLGTTQDEVVTQTSQYVIQLGETTFDFSTTTGPVVETVDEYSGPGGYADPGPFPSDLLVGTVAIPGNATGVTISGAFGNISAPNSSGANVCLGAGPCGAVIPEASTWAMMLLAFAGLGFLGYRASRKSAAFAA
jgi:hypothetical protein